MKKDSWFMQKDFIERCYLSPFAEEEFCTVLNNSESHVESIKICAHIVRPGDVKDRITKKYYGDASWQRISSFERVKLVASGPGYLGRAYCNYHKIRGGGSGVYRRDDSRDWVVRAQHRCSRYMLQKTETIEVLTDDLRQFLHSRKYVLIFHISCHRFSERALGEFGLQAGRDYRRGSDFTYCHSYGGGIGAARKRMQSISMVEGERILEL